MFKHNSGHLQFILKAGNLGVGRRLRRFSVNGVLLVFQGFGQLLDRRVRLRADLVVHRVCSLVERGLQLLAHVFESQWQCSFFAGPCPELEVDSNRVV
jgi:hypothetical protein